MPQPDVPEPDVIELRGSSWDHERGHAPMVATAAEYERITGGAVRVSWEPRSLKDFGVAPVEELAKDYDLVVIDHPHIGLIAETGSAAPLDELAVDTACQVSAWRPDLLPDPPRTWDQVLALSRQGRVLWPLSDVDLAASDPRCLSMNPIAVLDTLAARDEFWYAPLTFGYLNYARPGHPGHRVAFGDIPAFTAGPPQAGALLGGAGLMVSAYRGPRTWRPAASPRTARSGRTAPPTRRPGAFSAERAGPCKRPGRGRGRQAWCDSRTR